MKFKKAYSIPLLAISLVGVTNIGIKTPEVFTKPLMDKVANQASMPKRCPLVIINPYIQQECHEFYEYNHEAGGSILNSEYMDKFTKLIKSYGIVEHLAPKTYDDEIIKAHRRLAEEFYRKEANYLAKFPVMAHTAHAESHRKGNQSLLVSLNFATALTWLLIGLLIVPIMKLPFKTSLKHVMESGN
ncbi:hypothetical protein ACQKQC_18585 [Vibrio fortis]|uniref:hypothetical protein n=1 Tax=Vibrio fortis TaxID=212667 RepID=UPI0040690F40